MPRNFKSKFNIYIEKQKNANYVENEIQNKREWTELLFTKICFLVSHDKHRVFN